MKRLFYTLIINLPETWQVNEEIYFPYVPAIEGKTIIGINTYTYNNGGQLTALNNVVLPFQSTLKGIYVNFSNKENLLIIQDYPYNAFINTDVQDINNNQSRSIQQQFAFVFSSKFSYLVNKDTPLANPERTLQFRFTYLDK
jgi:hypothetical protein